MSTTRTACYLTLFALLLSSVSCGGGASEREGERVEEQGAALSSQSCIVGNPVPVGYFVSTSCTTSNGSIHEETCVCYPTSPTNPTVALDWTMPPMTGLGADGEGVVDLSPPSNPPGTPPAPGSYATPSSWQVILDGCASTPAPQYAWQVTGLPPIANTSTCTTTITVPALGKYHATMTALYANGARSVAEDITAKNFVIVSMGDSIASGEGNPDVPAVWSSKRPSVLATTTCLLPVVDPFNPLLDLFGTAYTATGGCSSTLYPSVAPVWGDTSCHRSARSGPALAAMALEQADRHSSVTFISEACSGAAILEPQKGDLPPGNGGILDPYEGEEALPGGVNWAPQLSAIALALCPKTANPPISTTAQNFVNPVKNQCRAIDALLLQGGANDVGFGTAAIACAVPGFDCSTNDLFTRDIANAVSLLPGELATLGASIQSALNVRNVYFPEYPDPTHDQTGQLCNQIVLPNAIDDIVNDVPGFVTQEYIKGGIDAASLIGKNLHDGVIKADAIKWLSQNLITPLNQAIAAAAPNNWTPITGIANDFSIHGYCSTTPWVVQYPDSKRNQLNSDGTFHPNALGHQDYEQHIFNALFNVLIAPSPPTISSQPASITVSPGGTATFSVGDSSTCGLLQNQWQFNGVNLVDGPGVSGSTTGILKLTAVTAAQAGAYRVVVSCASGGGTAISSMASLQVKPAGAPPVITGQPASLTASPGGIADFIVDDSSSCGQLVYQWQFDGVNLTDTSQVSGSNAGILQVNGLTSAQAGSYQVIVSCANGAGSATSSVATLVVKPNGVAPVISGQPLSVTIAPGGEADFIVDYSSTCGPITYQWQLNGVNLTDGAGVLGSNAGILELTNVTATQAGSYRIIITCTNGVGSTTSNAATLVVKPTGVAPVITGQPASLTVAPAADADFFVLDTTTCGALQYQWQRNGAKVTDGAGISGSKTGILELTGVSAAQAGTYQVAISCANGAGTTTSAAATLVVAASNGSAPVITAQPQSTTVSPGGSTAFGVADSSSCGPVNYQWQLNGANLTDGTQVAGSETALLQLSSATAAQAGSYRIVITCANGAGVSTSNAATLVVAAGGSAPVITSQPSSVTVAPGDGADFGVSDATSCGNLVYQWQFNGVNLTDGTGISGSKTGLLELTAATAAQAGAYKVIVSCANGEGSTTSSPATLVVAVGSAPVITGQPQSTTVSPGGSTAFGVAVSSTCGALKYQWQLNGVNLANGTAELLQLTNVTAAQAGSYQVIVSCVNGAGTTTSSAATLVVESGGSAPVITGQPQSVTAASGGAAAFVVDDSTTCGNLVYQWQLNGFNLTDGAGFSGSKTGILELTAVTAAQAGFYTVIVSCANGEGSTTSSAASLVVTAPSNGSPPVITSEPQSTTVAAGASARFGIGDSSSCGTLDLQWQRNGVNLVDGTGVTGSATELLQLTSVTAAEAGSYRVIVSCANGAGATTSSVATLAVQ